LLYGTSQNSYLHMFYFHFETLLGIILDGFDFNIFKVHIVYPYFEIPDVFHDDTLQFKEWRTFLLILHYIVFLHSTQCNI
jgi:hypothetical protein